MQQDACSLQPNKIACAWSKLIYDKTNTASATCTSTVGSTGVVVLQYCCSLVLRLAQLSGSAKTRAEYVCKTERHLASPIALCVCQKVLKVVLTLYAAWTNQRCAVLEFCNPFCTCSGAQPGCKSPSIGDVGLFGVWDALTLSMQMSRMTQPVWTLMGCKAEDSSRNTKQQSACQTCRHAGP